MPARLRMGVSWSDACILNVSSGGLLIHAHKQPLEGSVVELRRGECSIVARVIWRDGPRAGLRAEHRIPVEDIMGLGAPQLQLTAQTQLTAAERRRRSRTHAHSRLRARGLEFAAVSVIAASLACVAFAAVEHALQVPTIALRAALAG